MNGKQGRRSPTAEVNRCVWHILRSKVEDASLGKLSPVEQRESSLVRGKVVLHLKKYPQTETDIAENYPKDKAWSSP